MSDLLAFRDRPIPTQALTGAVALGGLTIASHVLTGGQMDRDVIARALFVAAIAGWGLPAVIDTGRVRSRVFQVLRIVQLGLLLFAAMLFTSFYSTASEHEEALAFAVLASVVLGVMDVGNIRRNEDDPARAEWYERQMRAGDPLLAMVMLLVALGVTAWIFFVASTDGGETWLPWIGFLVLVATRPVDRARWREQRAAFVVLNGLGLVAIVFGVWAYGFTI